MMTKLLSLVLSFTILFTSVAPSYAQARNAQRRAGAAQPAAVEQYDDMKEHDCKRDAKGNVVAVDLSLPENEKALQEMLASADAFEWKSCAYVAGLKNYFEKNPKRARSLTAWQRNSVIYPATEQYIKRWNANSSARENSTFRQIFIDLNAVVMKDVPNTQTAYIFRPTKNKFLRVVDPNTIEKKVEEKTSAGQADGAQSTGSIFGLPGGTGTFSGPSADLLKEVEKVYEMLTQDPSASNDSSSSLSYEEFAELYEQDVRYAYSGAMANNAQQHINKPGWSEYVAKMNQAMEKELSAAKIKEAYDEYLKNLEQMDGGIQEEVQKYLQDLAAQIWEMYSADKALWLGVVQDVFPVFQMYGGLSDTVRQKAAAAMREEIRKHQDDCEKPGFFSMLTLKGLAQTVTLHQSQGAKDLVTEHVMKMNASCAYATKAATALAVLGQWGEETADSQAIQEWFKKGFNFSSSGLVIPTALSALLAMGAYDKAANMVAYAGEKSDTKETLQAVFGGLSVLEWTQLFQSGDSHWSEQVNLEYSYYEDDKGVQRNIWMDTADFLVEAYVAADAREQKRMNEFFRKSVESLITPREPFNKQLRFALRPFLVGVFTHHLVSVRLSDSDLGEVRFKAPVSVLLDLDKIVDKDNKKQIKQLFKEIRKDKVPYHTLLMWYLFLSNKNDVHPEMRIAFDSRLADAIFNSTDNRAWRQEVTTLIEKEQASLSDSLDSFSSWNETKENLVPLDDLVSLFFLYQGGKGLFSLLKFVGRSIGVLSGNVVNLLRMMRSVQLGNVPQMGKNLGRMLKVGLKEFKSSSFARLKTMAIRKIRTRRNMPKFTPKPTEPTMGPSAARLPVARRFRRPKRQKLPPQRPVDVRVLNGQYYMVPKGTETFYVRGQVQFVPKGTLLAEVAKQFGVDVREVVLAKNGSVAPKASQPLRNYSMGDGVNGATGSQPLGGRPGKPVTIHPREVAVKPQTPASLVKPGEKAALVYQSGEWRAVSVPEELTKAEIADKFKVSVDDVDYVVKFADGTFAPEWAEYSLVWDVLQSPAPSSTALNLTRWQWMKLNAAVTFDIFTNNLRDLVSFPWRNPVRAAGMAGSSFGLGGVAPVAFYAEAPATASQVVSFGETSARFLSATRTAEAAGAVSTATTAGAEMAGATRTATQLGSGWFNLFWGARAVTDPWFLTPVGALPSAGTRWNGKISKWELSDTYKKYRAQLNKWLFASSALQRQHNPWFLRDTWIDLTNSAILGYKEWRMSLAGNSAYLSSLKSTLNFIPETVNETARFTARFIVTPDGTVIDRHNTSEADAAAAIADPDEETTPDLERQGNEAATTNGASSSSGILYSGIPVMAVEAFGKKIYNEAVRLFTKSVDTHAQDVLGRKLPLLTELRDIVTGDASRRLKEQALLRLHKQFNVFSAVIGHLPVESRNKFNALKQDDTQVAKFLYNLYSTGQLDNVLAGLNNHIPVDELSKQLEEITSTPEFDAARRKVYDETEVLPFDANDWQGYVETVQDVDKGLIEQLFRPAGWAAQSAADGKEDSKGNVYYENDIPVYYRNSKGDLSAHPVIILHQDVLSSRLAEAWADLLNKVGLSTGKGFKIPKGLVLALDENGRFKLVLQPGHRADLLNSKTGRKMKETIYSEGSLPVDLSTQYSTTDLLAVARLLEAGVKADFQLTLDAPSSFSLFVSLLGAFSGLGADTVMVGPFKEAAGPDNPAVPNAFGGVGYVTPRVAAATVDDMKTWGVSRSVVALLTVTLTTLVVSALMGINGLVPKEEFSLIALAVPLLVLITGGSMIRSVIPLILNAYKDPRQRTAANLDVATWQQGSKLFMFFATAFWWGAGEKFVAVPIAATLVLATLGLFFNTPAGRKVLSDTVTAFKDHPKESFKAMGKGSLILGKHLLKGFVEGVFAPVIWGGKQVKAGFEWASSKLKSSRETTTSAAAQAGSETGAVPTEGAESAEAANARYQAEYEESFKKNPEVKNSLLRVTLAYASYAASLMLLNQLAEGPIDGSLSPLIDELLNQLPEGPISWLLQKLIGVGVGKWLTFAFASASFLVRLFASKWVKSGKFTDDQLTGISFAGMSLAALGLAGVPYEGLGIVAVLLLGIILFASTAVPGQLDQARLQNLVSAMVQSQKNEVLQDKSLSQAEKEAKIADLEAKESKWAGWAKADYDKANANGIWGVYAAIILSIALPRLGIGDWSWIARSVFVYAGVVAGLGALKTGDHSLSFLRALFSKKKTLVVTAEDIAAGKVNAETFGMTDAGKANKLVPSLLKGKDSLKTLKEQLMPYGVVAISSEVKLTKVLKRLIEIHNRFVASAEKLGDEALHASFEEVLAVAKDFNAVMKGSNVSESLRREFAKLVTALCVDGSLDKGVLSHPAYMEEGSFAMPINYRNLLEARDIIKELDQLATNIGQGGAAVNANTYGQFVQYHAEAKRLLQTYAAENPSESLIVKLEEERIRLLCLKLKNANSVHNVLRANAGQTPAKDIQNLEDILRVYEGNMTISSEWVVFYQSATEEAIGFFEAHPAMAQEVERMLASVEAENWKEFMGMDAMGLPRESEVEDVAAGIIGSAATAPKLSGTSELQALYIAPLEELLQATQQGQTLDEATQGDIAELYLRADQAMTQYLNSNPKEGTAVVAMHAQLDKLYTQLIGEAPTKEKVAELAKKSSGLMSMVDWFGQLWEDLLAWFKGGDDSPGANDGSGDLSALPSSGGGAVQLARLPGKKEVDAVIFDMDGTLLNTLWAWKNSTSNFLRSRGIEPPENIDAEMAELSLLEGARVLKERYGFKESPEELLEEVLATVRKFYEEDAMPKPGVPGVLQALKKQGIKICVATASDRKFAEAAFKRTGLMEYIDFIITCDEVGVGKHNPLVYETALKKLGTNRKRTLVVEDALYALQTAKKAGFPTAGVYEVDFAADQSALQSDATYYVPSFQTVVVGN